MADGPSQLFWVFASHCFDLATLLCRDLRWCSRSWEIFQSLLDTQIIHSDGTQGQSAIAPPPCCFPVDTQLAGNLPIVFAFGSRQNDPTS
jgi:hypothetical protein